MKYFINNQEVSCQKFYGSLKRDIQDTADIAQAKEMLKEGKEILAGEEYGMNAYRMEVKQCQQ